MKFKNAHKFVLAGAIGLSILAPIMSMSMTHDSESDYTFISPFPLGIPICQNNSGVTPLGTLCHWAKLLTKQTREAFQASDWHLEMSYQEQAQALRIKISAKGDTSSYFNILELSNISNESYHQLAKHINNAKSLYDIYRPLTNYDLKTMQLQLRILIQLTDFVEMPTVITSVPWQLTLNSTYDLEKQSLITDLLLQAQQSADISIHIMQLLPSQANNRTISDLIPREVIVTLDNYGIVNKLVKNHLNTQSDLYATIATKLYTSSVDQTQSISSLKDLQQLVTQRFLVNPVQLSVLMQQRGELSGLMPLMTQWQALNQEAQQGYEYAENNSGAWLSTRRYHYASTQLHFLHHEITNQFISNYQIDILINGQPLYLNFENMINQPTKPHTKRSFL